MDVKMGQMDGWITGLDLLTLVFPWYHTASLILAFQINVLVQKILVNHHLCFHPRPLRTD